MAHKKGVGSSKNGRDSNPQYRGVKKYGGEQVVAILADPLDPGRPLGRRAWQAVVEGTSLVRFRPVRQGLRQQPFWRRQGQHIQRMPERLVDALDPVHRPGRGQDMGGVRALPSPGLEQTMSGRNLQNGIQQQRLGGPRHQARPELAQHRAVEAGVGERQAEEILPVDPAPDSIGRLAIRQPLRELQQGHQRQAPWRLGRLALGREEAGEAAVVEDRAEPVAQAQQQVAARERQTRDMGRVVRNRQRRRRAQAHGQPRMAQGEAPSTLA